MGNAMHDFQWVASEFLLRHLTGELIAAGIVLAAVIALTAVLVARELRGYKEDGHADQ